MKLIIIAIVISSCTNNHPRVVEDFNSSWKFYLGDDSLAKSIDFNDADWRVLNLPHDWSIEGEFCDSNSTGAAGGFLPAGIGWYRKIFKVPVTLKHRIVYIDFDGIYRNSEIWVNGHYLGKRPNGYASFRHHLTPYIKFGEENILVVKVDNSLQPNSRWYTGSGIYRNVKLVTTGKVHIDYCGTFITTPEVTDSMAKISYEYKILNFLKQDTEISIVTSIFNPDGKAVINCPVREIKLQQDSLINLNEVFIIKNPELWSTDNPSLYKAFTSIYIEGVISDTYTTIFGIKNFKFDLNKGFFLNGKNVKIYGVNDHHDLGALGAAVNKRAIERKLEIYKKMGCNAIRTAHNPPAPELLNLCDEMGLLVIDEAFDCWSKKKMKKDCHLDWNDWHKKDLENLILRDRNHPSVIMWSIGNEIREQFDSSGIRITKELVEIVKNIDTTRPVTCALTENIPEKNYIYQSGALDILSFNYKQQAYKDFQKNFPSEMMIAAENMSALATRGHYDMPSDSIRIWPPAYKQPFDTNADFTVSAYDNAHAYWGSTHEESWDVVKNLDYVSGLFIWSGFDYLGEPVPYDTWPARSSYYGVIDLAGFPKDAYYMYQSEWSDDTMLHIFPHWNWHKGDVIDVWAYYNNADEVELIVNGKSVGSKAKPEGKYHVMWRVEYEPGNIKAITKKDGKVVLEKEIRTSGEAAKLELIADRNVIKADGYDLSFITVKVLDKDGNFVPYADNLINFTICGSGFIAGVDNGYQASHEPFKANYRKAYHGMCLAIIQNNGKKGTIKLTAKSKGLQSEEIEIKCR